MPSTFDKDSRETPREVAIKLCGKLGMFNDGVEAFRFEVTLMNLLDHPNVLTCLGANETDEEPFLILPIYGEPMTCSAEIPNRCYRAW